MMMKSSLAALLILATTGCAGGFGEDGDVEPPVVIGLSKTELSIGESIDIVGANFFHGPEGHARVRFEGTFFTDDGAEHPVDLEFRPHWEDGNRLVWAHVGPYKVPFSPTGSELGTFEGTLTAINVARNGGEAVSEPADVSLRIKPSLILKELQPVDADCTNPSRVILDNFEYKLSVEALGFEPVNYTYITYSPFGQSPRIIRRQAFGNVDSFGSGGEIYFDPVPDELPFYVGTLAIAALGTDGEERVLALNIGVHRPVEYIVLDRVEIAEIEAARPVSGCNAGGTDVPRTVTYSETETETRSRTVGVNWNEEWLQSHSSTVSESRTTTNSVGVAVSQSETNGYNFTVENGRDIEGGGSAGGSLFGLVEVGVEGKYRDIRRESRSVYGETTRGYTVNQDYSVSDTESWAYTSTEGYNVSLGGSDFWTVESSNSTIVGFQGTILPGQFGVFYRQTTRMSVPGAVVAYNRCGVPEVVAEGDFFDFTWSVDLASANQCPPLPKSNLPEPECFIAPCSGAQ